MELKLKMKFYFIFFILYSNTASALFLKNLNMEMEPSKGIHYEEITNETLGRKIYTLQVVQVSLPKGGAKETEITNGNLMYSPQKIVLNSHETGGFKFYYKDEPEDKERYFRIKFIETPIEMDTIDKSKMTFLYDYRVAIEAIMVVRPRKEIFEYEMKNGILLNKGNTFFKYMSSKDCKRQYSHSKFIAPGESVDLNDEIKKENRIIIYKKNIIPLSTCMT